MNAPVLEHPSRADASIEHLFRHQAGQMLAVLSRIFGLENLDLVEDVVQDALVQAVRLWPYHGVPDNPSAWIIRVAKNRALEILRRDGTWSAKEKELRRTIPPTEDASGAAFAQEVRDDQLLMIFACCHPALSRDAQVALTLKTVGGLSVGELARAYLTRDSTMAQRLVRAKRRLRKKRVRLVMPGPETIQQRLDAVLEVLYLMFNEGYSAHEGEDLVRTDLCREAIRLAGLVCEHPLTQVPKAHALLALFLFQGARFKTRVGANGDLLLLAEQDRSLWDRSMIGQALRQLKRAGRGPELSRYHLEAEIAACHALEPSIDTTDWARILDCYEHLMRLNPSPVVAVNRLVALARVAGPHRALEDSTELIGHPSLAGYYPAYATHGELLAEVRRTEEAIESFRRALELTPSQPIRRYLLKRLRRLDGS